MLFLLFFFLSDGDEMMRARARSHPVGRGAQGAAVRAAERRDAGDRVRHHA